MKLDPHSLRAASLWALAQSAERHQQWQAAYNYYAQFVAIYQQRGDATTRIPDTLHIMCRFAKTNGLWSCVVESAKMLLVFYAEHPIEYVPSLWLMIGQAERQCHNIEAARHALCEVVRLSEGEIEGGFSPWARRMLTHATALSEWALLEADEGLIPESLSLLALGELVINQGEGLSIYDVGNVYASQDLEDELATLCEVIIATRTRLELYCEEMS